MRGSEQAMQVALADGFSLIATAGASRWLVSLLKADGATQGPACPKELVQL